MPSVDIASPGDFYAEFLKPDRTLAGPVSRFISGSFKRLELGMRRGEMKIDLEQDWLSHAYTYSGIGTRTALAWALTGYTANIYYRGTLFLDGIRTYFKAEDVERRTGSSEAGPAEATVKLWAPWEWYLENHLIYGTGSGGIGARFTQTSKKPDDIVKELLRANMTLDAGAGYPIEPAYYAANSLNREFHGPHTIAIAADTGSHPTTDTRARFTHGKGLRDQVLEYCRRWNMRLSGSWSGTTYTIDVIYPATGDDLTDTIVFERERQNLYFFSYEVDPTKATAVVEVKGQGRHDGQARAHKHHTDFYLLNGIKETGEVIREADATDCEDDAEFVITQIGGQDTKYEAECGEVTGQLWPDFDQGDKVTINVPRYGLTVEDWIAELELTKQGHNAPDLKIRMGREEENADTGQQRSGGGGRGGRRGGGTANKQDGESEVDPDDIKSYFTIQTQGAAVDAEGANHYVKLAGFDTATYARVETAGTDSSASDVSGTPDTVTDKIVVTVAATQVTGNKMFLIRGDDGQIYQVPCRQLGQ